MCFLKGPAGRGQRRPNQQISSVACTDRGTLCAWPPRLGGASNLVENQINLAAGRRTLYRLFLSTLSLALPRLWPACLRPSFLDDTSKSKERDWEEGGEGGGPEVLHATDTDLEARREGGAATKSFGLLAATRPGPYLSRSSSSNASLFFTSIVLAHTSYLTRLFLSSSNLNYKFDENN